MCLKPLNFELLSLFLSLGLFGLFIYTFEFNIDFHIQFYLKLHSNLETILHLENIKNLLNFIIHNFLISLFEIFKFRVIKFITKLIWFIYLLHLNLNVWLQIF